MFQKLNEIDVNYFLTNLMISILSKSFYFASEQLFEAYRCKYFLPKMSTAVRVLQNNDLSYNGLERKF